MGTESDYLLPIGTYDTHVHIFDRQLGPYSPCRAYTPNEAPLEDLHAFSARISSTSLPTNFVLVQPSPYGTDNTVLLSTLRRIRESKDRLREVRAIAVFDPVSTSDDELDRMHNLGVRGLRLNLQASGGQVDYAALKESLIGAANRVKHLPGWKIQIYCPAQAWDIIFDTVLSLPVEVIADHLGGLKGPSKLSIGDGDNNNRGNNMEDIVLGQPGFRSLLRLAKSSRVSIKVSGLYRASTLSETGYNDLAPIIRTLAEQVPDRLVWASDWPHTGEGKDRTAENALTMVEPFRVIDNLCILKNLREWIGSDENWHKMMVSNPETLYE